MGKPLVSFVVPVYNEESNVLPFYEAVSYQALLLDERYDFEFVFTDNHSTDRTYELLESLANKDDRIRVSAFLKTLVINAPS
jgi:dolichol-phosphate mannosyltransferase